MSRFNIGLTSLDREYDGLFPGGHISAVDSSFKSDSDKFIYHIINNNTSKSIIYITLQKNEQMLNNIFESSRIIDNSERINIVDLINTKNISDEINKTLQKAPKNSVVVIDPILEVEQGTDNYKKLFNEIYTIVNKNNLLLLLYNSDINNKQSQITFDFSDSVVTIDYKNTGGVEFDHFLTISKFRNREEFEEKEKLDILENEVKIDTTRNVA